ncbi:hypothetical protein PFISCL1PPCAC_999, partial [Pristionchus fissidentatus]
LLFALCSSRSRTLQDELSTLPEILAVIHEQNPKKRLAIFTPSDHLFAFRGATDDPAIFAEVLELFKMHALTNVEGFVKRIVGDYPKDVREELLEGYRQDYYKMCLLMAECAIGQTQYDEVAEKCAPYLAFAKKPMPVMFKDRAKTIEKLTTDYYRTEWMDKAIVEAEYLAK